MGRKSLLLGSLFLAACASQPAAPPRPALNPTVNPALKAPALKAVAPLTPVEASDLNARVLLDALAPFAPEQLGQLGIAGLDLDREIADLKPGVNARVRASIDKAAQEIDARALKSKDPFILQDLAILRKAAQDNARSAELEEKYELPYEGLDKKVFIGLHALLSEQVPAERRQLALVRLKKYAGLDGANEPIAKLAADRTREKLARPGLIGPVRAEVEKDLADAPTYRKGIADMFAKFQIAGFEAPLATLNAQLTQYDDFVKAEVLPRSRVDFRQPPELYAHRLARKGVDAEPEAIAKEAHRGFADTKKQMEILAKEVAREKGFSKTDYRSVIRELKRDQLVGDAVRATYEKRIGELEEIIRREKLVTLPQRPMRFRIATAAETAEQPAPHVDAQGLLAKKSELFFVLPLTVPGKTTLKYDDFTFGAASWTLTAHEGRPGHDLQFSAMAERGVSLARTLFAFNSVNVEGWALYAEYITRPFMPKDGQLISLQLLLLREARAFLDPELQLGKIDIKEAGRILRDEVGISDAFATEELERYTFNDPGQAPSYFFGYEKLLALRADVERAMGKSFDAKQFHDFVLSEGLLPPALLRKAVTEHFLAAPAPAPAVSSSAAGGCIDEQRDAWHRLACDAGEPCGKLRAGQSPGDLDGDGIPERLWAAESLCGATGNCQYEVYLTSKGCPRYAGSVGGVAVHALGSAHHGVRDLSAYWKGGCVGMEGAWTENAFDGQSFQVTKTIACACPTGWPGSMSTDPKRDPMCPSAQ